jgi:hypothetical protein
MGVASRRFRARNTIEFFDFVTPSRCAGAARQLTAHGGWTTLAGDEWPVEQNIIEPFVIARSFHLRRIQGRKPDDTNS